MIFPETERIAAIEQCEQERVALELMSAVEKDPVLATLYTELYHKLGIWVDGLYQAGRRTIPRRI